MILLFLNCMLNFFAVFCQYKANGDRLFPKQIKEVQQDKD